jgi:ribosomal protein S18 acetylase RimI-like enzyme
MALTFRKVVRPERDEAQRILWSAFTPYVRNLGREITTHHYTFLPAAIERGDVYFAVDGDEIVGVAATERRYGGIYIDRLSVDPARQAPGSEASCWSGSRGIARANGLKGLALAEMAEGNIRLYRRHGFEIIGRGLPSHGMDAYVRVHMAKVF